jgi:hypothetical protein
MLSCASRYEEVVADDVPPWTFHLDDVHARRYIAWTITFFATERSSDHVRKEDE